jgi:SAM-dependent methyltransferase
MGFKGIHTMSTEWSNENVFRNKPEDFSGPAWPHEILVKLFSSPNYSKIASNFGTLKNAKVLEVGCMYCNNIRFFHSRGARSTGVEVTEDMVKLAERRLQQYGLSDCQVSLGSNRSLPFPDAQFDAVVSINTIHYETGNGVMEGLNEFKRVLRPGGIAFVETAGAGHFIRQGAERLDLFRYKPRFNDFRDSGVYGLFDSIEHFEKTFRDCFREVEVGKTLESFPNRTLEFFFAVVSK